MSDKIIGYINDRRILEVPQFSHGVVCVDDYSINCGIKGPDEERYGSVENHFRQEV